MKPDNMTYLKAGVGKTADIRTFGVTGSYSHHFFICSEPSQLFCPLPAREAEVRPYSSKYPQ